ncbi:MAG: branched-chain amino acid ABC transporter permease [Alphaproteobacteria bacterium]|nr:branched-chain amino acid ABC transporter permease [Alphaproteobacteria bacterium]
MMGYLEGIIAILCINLIFAYGVFLTAASGQLNLGGGGFQALGAYIAGVCSNSLEVPIFVSVIAGIIGAGVVGFLLSFPVLRTKGVYMVLATFAFALVVSGIILNSDFLGGATGMSVPAYLPVNGLIFSAIGVVMLVFWIMASRIGLAMRSIHDDDLVSEIMGINVRGFQVFAFTLGGALAGFSGALYAHHYSFIEAQYFSALLSIFVLLYVLIGGTQTAWGPLIGASFFTLIPELLRVGDTEWRYVIFGVLIVFMMIFRPEGIVTRTLVHRIGTRFSRNPGVLK